MGKLEMLENLTKSSINNEKRSPLKVKNRTRQRLGNPSKIAPFGHD
jgi:hypothetical protein